MVSVRLRHIVRDKDRHGNVRVYFRRRGKVKVRIHERIGSSEFFAAYNRLLEESQTGRSAPVVKSKTLRWLCLEYFEASAFRQLDQRTKADLRRRRLYVHQCQDRARPSRP